MYIKKPLYRYITCATCIIFLSTHYNNKILHRIEFILIYNNNNNNDGDDFSSFNRRRRPAPNINTRVVPPNRRYTAPSRVYYNIYFRRYLYTTYNNSTTAIIVHRRIYDCVIIPRPPRR